MKDSPKASHMYSAPKVQFDENILGRPSGWNSLACSISPMDSENCFEIFPDSRSLEEGLSKWMNEGFSCIGSNPLLKGKFFAEISAMEFSSPTGVAILNFHDPVQQVLPATPYGVNVRNKTPKTR